MPQVLANGLTLEYETFGEPGQPAILLIMGLGGQLILWPDEFCEALSRAGYFVIRYDNRDIGLSSKLDSLGRPNLLRAGLAYKLGLPVKAPYTLEDMSADALALLDALQVPHAHVLGASMGGMIAQILAARHPDRVRGLVLVMTNSGHPRAPGPSLRIGLRLVRRPPPGKRMAHIRHHIKTWKLVGSPVHRPALAEMRAYAERSYDRAHNPRGIERHAAAVLATGNRVPLLSRIQSPVLIIHGLQDRLMPAAAGLELASHLPHAQVELVDGMGHDFPKPLIPRIARSVVLHLRRSERGAPVVPRVVTGRPEPTRWVAGLQDAGMAG